MAIYTTLKVVDKNTGLTVLNVDESGFKDVGNRVFQSSMYLHDRLAPTPLAAYIWTCQEGTWQVQSVSVAISVTGGAACVVAPLVCASGVAPGSGTTQLTASIDIEETAPFTANGAVIASPTIIFPGMSISRLISGTVGSLEGRITIQLKRIS